MSPWNTHRNIINEAGCPLFEYTEETGRELEAHGIPRAFFSDPQAGQSLANTAPFLVEALVKEGEWDILLKRASLQPLETPSQEILEKVKEIGRKVLSNL